MIHYLRAKYHANLPISPANQWDDDYLPIGKGQICTVRIRQKMFGRIEVQVMRDDDPTREIVGSRITYPNLFYFFEDWEPKQVSLNPHFKKENLYHGTKQN